MSLEWMALKACRPEHTDLFFPVDSGYAGTVAMRAAVAICQTCPVQQECAEYALGLGEVHGVFGGLTPDDRAQIRERSDRAERVEGKAS